MKKRLVERRSVADNYAAGETSRSFFETSAAGCRFWKGHEPFITPVRESVITDTPSKEAAPIKMPLLEKLGVTRTRENRKDNERARTNLTDQSYRIG